MLYKIGNWAVANAEMILTVIGFLITLIELRRTKNAVNASKKATEHTMQLLSDRSTISDIAVILVSLRETQTALRGGRYEAAVIRLQDVRDKLFGLRNRDGFKNDDRLQQIQEMIFALKKAQDSIEIYLSQPDKGKIQIARHNNQLAEFTSLLSGWNNEMQYTQRSTENG